MMSKTHKIFGLVAVLLFLGVYWTYSQSSAKDATVSEVSHPQRVSDASESQTSFSSSKQPGAPQSEDPLLEPSSPTPSKPSSDHSSFQKEVGRKLAEHYGQGPVNGIPGLPSRSKQPKYGNDPLEKIHPFLREPGQSGTFPGPSPMNYPRYDQQGRVLVRIFYEPGEDREEAVQHILKGDETAVYAHLPEEGILEAYTFHSRLEEWAAQSWVRKIIPVAPARTRMGSVTTEAVHALGIADLRETFQVMGQGVKIGVISSGVDNIHEAQATGDLPEDVVILANGGWGTPDDEGTAMLEIIHDVAPGAGLYFHDGGSEIRFIKAVRGFKNAGCDIIVDDIGYFTEPVFEDGPVAQEVQKAVDEGIVFISAAGNDAIKHAQTTWSAQHRHPEDPNLHKLLFGYPALVFPSDEETMEFVLEPGNSLGVYLQWNEKFGASSHDYDLFVYKASDYRKFVEDTLVYGEWDLSGRSQFEEMGYWVDSRGVRHSQRPPSPSAPAWISAGSDTQDGEGNPLEFALVSNTSSGKESYLLVIEGFDTVQESDILKMFFTIWNALGVNGVPGPAGTSEGSVFGHPATPGCLAIGAVDVNDPELDTIQSFSSQGPCYVPFSETVWRSKPDFVSVDGVSVSGAGSFLSPFYGTSAAAPHIAGLVALLKEADPSLTPDGVRRVLTQTATDLGDPGHDNLFGYGFVDLERALDFLNSGELTTDSSAPLVELFFRNGQKIDLKCKAAADQKNWVLLEAPEAYPGLTFVRPSDAVTSRYGRYLFLFKYQGNLIPEADSLYFSETYPGEKIDFGVNDFSGLGKTVITIQKGMAPDNLETIQEISLIPL